MREPEKSASRSGPVTEIAIEDAAALSLLAAYPSMEDEQYQQVVGPIKQKIVRDIARVLRSDAMGQPLPKVGARARDAARELRRSVLAYEW